MITVDIIEVDTYFEIFQLQHNISVIRKSRVCEICVEFFKLYIDFFWKN